MLESQVPVPLIYDGINLECGYRADSVIEKKVLIETKCIESIAPIHVAQVLTYLKFLNLKLGLILNFNEVLMKNGIKRIVHNL